MYSNMYDLQINMFEDEVDKKKGDLVSVSFPVRKKQPAANKTEFIH